MTCAVCLRDPERMNNAMAECSHVDCPYRRHAWSERPQPGELYRGPWPRFTEEDPKPLDGELK